MKRFLLLLIKAYQIFISPLLHLITGPSFGCRFDPSCSQYAQEAFSCHGLWKGSILTIFRISRCHPFARAGYDPVPRAIGSSYSNPDFKTEGKTHGP